MSYNDSIVRVASTSREGCDEQQTAFVQWFHAHGGSLHAQCRLADFAAMGTGMVAADAIESDEILFSVPRHMLLNVRNSRLPGLCRAYDAQTAASSSSTAKATWDDVNVGWLGLMMTMMWEHARSTNEASEAINAFLQKEASWVQAAETISQAHKSNGSDDVSEAQAARQAHATMAWGPYFDILPTHFDTPMFWNDGDLAELRGTSIPDKIGKEEATAGYVETVRPYILAHTSIFLGALVDGDEIEALLDRYYSLDHFHMMGSRILSRSFHVKGDEGIGEGRTEGVHDSRDGFDNEDSDSGGDSDKDDDSDEGAEQIEDVSMVPMADMLNARYGHDNARLFYRTHTLEMRATRRIEAGEQVWNTYGEPPSSDLLRRYGYVDLGNPADVVEVGLDDLLAGRMALSDSTLPATSTSRDAFTQRLAWACALGIDEVSPLTYAFAPSSTAPYRPPSLQDMPKSEVRAAALNLPEDVLVLARVLCLSDDAYAKAKAKDRLPSPRVDSVEQDGTLGVAQLLVHTIDARTHAYSTTIEQDETLLFDGSGDAQSSLSLNHRQAIVIRLSEKRILAQTKTILQAVVDAVQQKRKNEDRSAGMTKKARKA